MPQSFGLRLSHQVKANAPCGRACFPADGLHYTQLGIGFLSKKLDGSLILSDKKMQKALN
jgi:hypothetical protein